MMYVPRALPFGNKALEKCKWQFLSTMMCFELMVDVQNRSSVRHCYLSSNEGLMMNAFGADMLFS